MTTHLVTRHASALQWLLAQGMTSVVHVSHLDPADVAADDVVVGTLPMHLAALVCKRGARYFNLSINVPESARGRELSMEELTCFGARLEEYDIRKLAAFAYSAEASSNDAPQTACCLSNAAPIGLNQPD